MLGKTTLKILVCDPAIRAATFVIWFTLSLGKVRIQNLNFGEQKFLPIQRLFILTAFVASFILCSLSLKAQDLQLDSTLLTATDVATGLIVPWEVTYGPDDHLWVTERRGNVLRINPENRNIVTILNYQSQVEGGNSEYGMLGMALHPYFLNTSLLYVVYCYSQGGIRERLSSFEWDGTALVNETILLDEIQGGNIHDGSRLLITTDNKILMTTGDRGNSSLSQNRNSLNGKILRLNLDGTIPTDNPDPESYIYSFGHRNPQGLAYGPGGQIYSSEHGAQQSNEFNLIGPDANYGWPAVQGACNTPAEQTFCSAKSWPAGLYFIRATNGTGTITRTFTKVGR